MVSVEPAVNDEIPMPSYVICWDIASIPENVREIVKPVFDPSTGIIPPMIRFFIGANSSWLEFGNSSDNTLADWKMISWMNATDSQLCFRLEIPVHAITSHIFITSSDRVILQFRRHLYFVKGLNIQQNQ